MVQVMNVDQFVSHYGLVAIFLGCLIEGETVAITGGVFAHRHLLVLWQVTLAACLAAYLSDMGYFLAGRKFRENARLQSLMARPGFARALRAVDQNSARFAAVFRFIPGMRIVGPPALAQSRISTWRFATIAGIAAVVWSVLFTVLGHAVGMVIHAVFGRVHKGEFLLIVPIAVLPVLALFLVMRRQRRQHRHANGAPEPGLLRPSETETPRDRASEMRGRGSPDRQGCGRDARRTGRRSADSRNDL